MDPKKKRREPGELSPTEKAILERWSKGPTHFLQSGNQWFEVEYRCRPRDTDEPWHYGKIGKVCTDAEAAGKHIHHKIAQGHRLQVEILKVNACGNEVPIQSGKDVKTVTAKEYEEIAFKRDVEIFEHQDELDDELYKRTKGTAHSEALT